MEYGIDAMLPRPESLSLRFVCVVSLSLSLSDQSENFRVHSFCFSGIYAMASERDLSPSIRDCFRGFLLAPPIKTPQFHGRCDASLGLVFRVYKV